MKIRLLAGVVCSVVFFGLALAIPHHVYASHVKGIYITSSTAQNTNQMKHLVKNAKQVGIDTFVIDIYKPTKRYAKNIAMVKRNGIRYVARVVVFPHGGTRAQVRNQKYWDRAWRRASYAIKLGAEAIQLDYIRYNTRSGSSKQNVTDVHQVIKYIRNKMRGTGVKLQIDIFGVAAERPSYRIGQHVGVFAPDLNAINPMVYPSHYEPFRYHSERPYLTVNKSVRLLKKQLRNHQHVKVYAYLEISNYRYPMSWAKRKAYVRQQIRGALDAGADGFYIWSAKNKYRLLFEVLRDFNYKP